MTQSFMIRPYARDDLCSICVDGGVGLGQLIKILSDDERGLTHEGRVVSGYRNITEPVERFVDPKLEYEMGLPSSLINLLSQVQNIPKHNIVKKAFLIYHNIQQYFITHAHLDHVSGLVTNTPAFFLADARKTVKINGLPFTTDILRQHIFNDDVWPNLLKANGENGIILNELKELEPYHLDIFSWSILPFKVQHGTVVICPGHTDAPRSVLSTIYVIKDNPTNHHLVVCGDLERDSGSGEYLDLVWQYLASRVPPQNLKGIIIECSSSSKVPEKELYGHLNSRMLVTEIRRLCSLYNNEATKLNLHVIISHVKLDLGLEDPRLVIQDEISKLIEIENLPYVKFSIAVPGCTIYL